MLELSKQLIQSSIGKKFIVALTGSALVAFLIVHMAGNLQFFAGAEQINHYAYLLKKNPLVLWGFRLGLLACAVLHVVFTLLLVKENRAAKAVAYEEGKPYKASLASRTMAVSGLIVLFFIVFHILHFTSHSLPISQGYPALEADLPGINHPVHDVHAMIVEGFSIPWVSALYIVSVGLVCFHVSHGCTSVFQTLGLQSMRNRKVFDNLARVLAVVLFIGFASIPSLVLAQKAGLLPQCQSCSPQAALNK